MTLRGMEVRAEFRPWNDVIDFAVFHKNGNDRVYVAHPLTLEEHTAGKIITPTFSLSPDEAQKLMDELWRCGMRPAMGKGSEGAMAATERHLEDMRKIAFGLITLSPKV